MKFDNLYRQFRSDPESVNPQQLVMAAERENRIDEIQRIVERLRDQIAESIYEDADYPHYFEGAYEACSGWDRESNIYRRTIFFKDILDPDGPTITGRVTVSFEEGTPRVEGVTFRDPYNDIHNGFVLWSELAKEWMAK